MTEPEKFEIIGIKLHDKCKSGVPDCIYSLLPFDEWTEDIRKTINSVEVGKNRAYFSMDPELKDGAIDDKYIINKFAALKVVKDAFPKGIALWEKPFGNDSELKYVRFADGDTLTVIFNENSGDLESNVDACLAELVEGLPLWNRSMEKLKAMNSDSNISKPISAYTEDVKKKLEVISESCALQAHFTVNSRPKGGEDHDIWNELLQNANDHIGADDSSKKVVKICIGDNYLELEYPEAGFSVRDFLAVCTIGNSGNEASDQNREGHKGTGFKSVYNMFRKVTIVSNEVQCILEDVKREFSFEKDEIKVVPNDKNEPSEKYFPIPEFSKAMQSRKGTKFRFELKEGKNRENIITMIFGTEPSEGSLNDRFVSQNTFLFLNNITAFEFNISGELFSFNRKVHIENNFFYERKEFEPEDLPDDIVNKNERWRDISTAEKLKRKKSVEVLFPKAALESDKILDEVEKSVYCTLPISGFSLKLPFYMNVPLLELKDSRTSLKDDNEDIRIWNEAVLKSALKGFGKILEDHINEPDEGKENEGLNLTNLYRYFPYAYANQNVRNGKVEVDYTEGLKSVKFLRTTNGVVNGSIEFKGCSIEERVDILPEYMYCWFDKQRGLDGFCCKSNFLYYGKRVLDDGLFVKFVELMIQGKVGWLWFGSLEGSGVSDEICTYIVTKAYKLRGGDSVKENLEKITCAIDDKNELGNFIELLQESLGKYMVWENCRKALFQAFLLCCLGNSKEKYHCLNVDWNNPDTNNEIEIKRYINVTRIIALMKGLFCKQQLKDEDISYLKSRFPNLLESPYYVYDRKPCKKNDYTRSIRTDEALETVLSVLNESDIPDVLFEKTKEVLADGEVKNEDIRRWISKGWLYGKAFAFEEKIIPFTEDTYISSKYISVDSIKLISANEYGDSVKERLKTIYELRYLDSAINDVKFYSKEIGKKDFLISVLKAFQANVNWNVYGNHVRDTIYEYLSQSNVDNDQENKATLFHYMLKCDKEKSSGTIWTDNFKEYIPYCNQKQLNDSLFVFPNGLDSLAPLDRAILEQFDVKVSDVQKKRTQEKIMRNSSLETIVKDRVALMKGCKTAGRRLYCLAKKGDNEVIVLFTAAAFGTVLRELFDCTEYEEARLYDKMECQWDDECTEAWPDVELGDDERDKILEHIGKKMNEWMEDDSIFLEQLVGPYTKSVDGKVIHAKGYGGEESEDKCCPVCGAGLMAEKSLLDRKNVSYRFDKEGEAHHIYLPLLLCKNCSISYRYANDVAWRTEKEPKEILELGNLGNKIMPTVKIEFQFSNKPKEPKVREVGLTYLLRAIWWLLLKEAGIGEN